MSAAADLSGDMFEKYSANIKDLCAEYSDDPKLTSEKPEALICSIINDCAAEYNNKIPISTRM